MEKDKKKPYNKQLIWDTIHHQKRAALVRLTTVSAVDQRCLYLMQRATCIWTKYVGLTKNKPQRTSRWGTDAFGRTLCAEDGVIHHAC